MGVVLISDMEVVRQGRGRNVTITEKTIISFDPVKEHKTMMEWVKANDMNEWEKHESTIAFIFVREKTVCLVAGGNDENSNHLA